MKRVGWRFILAFLTLLAQAAWGDASDLLETREILFTSSGAKELHDQAAALATPVAIFEYVRNNYDFATYYGSRSSSLNTFLGGRGNDVDLATTLIAMLRAQGIQARYAVGTVRIRAADLQSWLKVRNLDLAVGILQDQGIQQVVKAADGSYVDLEHAWVEAYMGYDRYRGAGGANCGTGNPVEGCAWIALDPSLKHYTLKPAPIDIYAAVPFDYSRYYNAIKNQDQIILDKNPVAIYEEAILSYLQANYPGKTLDDVADSGVIETQSAGLLPASLPYTVVSAVRRYTSVDAHDAAVGTAEAKKWAMRLAVYVYTEKLISGVPQFDQYGQPIIDKTLIAGQSLYLSDLTTQRLTLSFGNSTDGCSGVCATLRQNGAIVLRSTVTASTSDRFILKLVLDGAPAITVGGTDDQIVATYYNNVADGYYLIGAGGETSNWSQVHRAADQLLAANAQYGQITGNSNRAATDALTGGLLQTAMAQYYARFRESVQRLAELGHVVAPIEGFVGVVSSNYDVEYVAGTAFGVLPGGLLIDMKGQRFAGVWRNMDAQTYATSQFELIGHAMSSLEHEIWQQLTGFDAVSTVRGIQLALAQSNSPQLVNPKNVPSGNNLATELPKFGLATNINLIYRSWLLTDIFYSYKPGKIGTWHASDWYLNTAIPVDGAPSNLSFGALKKTVMPSDPSWRKGTLNYSYLSNYSSLWDWLDCYDRHHRGLYYAYAGERYPWPDQPASPTNYALDPNSRYGTYTCAGAYITGYPYNESNTADSLWHKERTEFLSFYTANQTLFSYFDENSSSYPFVTTDWLYRGVTASASLQTLPIVASVRDNLLLSGLKLEYLLPSQRTVTPYNQFLVYIAKTYDSAGTTVEGLSFAIQNWGGGYVDGLTPLIPATSVPGTGGVLPKFNNATFTDQNTIAETNNDAVKTPSTVDPVSTVTGNNYHDETDLAIKGRGINYAFTRTYNSAPSSTKVNGPLGYGWTHSYAMRLKSNDYGSCPNCAPGTGAGQRPENGNSKTASITYTDERGGEHNYLVNESTLAVTPPQGEFDTLAFDAPVSGQHTLTFRNGVKYVFEGASTLKTTPGTTARLTQIADPWGNQLNFAYDGSGRLSTVTDNLGISGRTGLTFTYDASNHLTAIADWTGRQWRYSVDANGNLISYTNPLTQQMSYTYATGTHDLFEVIKPLQRSGQPVKTAFKYYENGRAFNYANTLGHTETLDYDLYRKATRVTDPRGGIREYRYDDSGRMTKLVEPDGAILLFDNTTNDGLRYKKTNGLGYNTQYSYRNDKAYTGASDTAGNVTREQDALNNTVDMTYGIYDQVATVKDQRGTVRTTSFHATTDGSCKTSGKPDTLTLSALSGVPNVSLQSLCWFTDGALKSSKDYITPGNTTRARTTGLNYDTAHLNVLSMTQTGTDGTTVTRSFTYDGLGRKTSETLPRRTSPTDATLINLTTTFTYDSLDRVTRVQDPLGHRLDTVFDANGQVVQLIGRYKQPDGSYVSRTLSTRTYDAADRLISETDVYNVTTYYQYDAASNLIAVIDPYQHTTRYEYDAMNRRTAVIDANGNRTTTSYDLAGQVKTVTNANGETATNSYDALGRLTSLTDPLGFVTQFSYDANGNRTCTVDANAQAGLQPKNSDNCTESRVYDELNRVVQVKDAMNGLTTTTYDLLGNLTSIKDATNKTTSFVYDDLGRHTRTTDPLAKSTLIARDQAGNAYQITNRLNQIMRITFDPLNRPTRYDYVTDGTFETLAYDPYGNKQTVANATVTYTFAYDAKNRLLSKTDSRAGKTLTFGYDGVDNLISKTDYQNQTTDFQYDSANRLVSMRNPAYLKALYQYDPAGRLLTRVLSDGAKSEYLWDANGRLTTLMMLSAAGNPVTNLGYTHDRLGNITQETGLQGAGQSDTRNYTYDALYRLTVVDATGTPNDENFTYDAVGNRLTHTAGGQLRTYQYLPSSNRLTTVRLGGAGGTIEKSFVYDDEGRLTSQTGQGAKTFTWDQKHRAKQIIAGATTNTFLYDPMDYRIGRTGGTLGSRDYYLEGEHLEAEYANGALQSKYFRGITTDELVAGFTLTNGTLTPSIYHHNQLTSVTGLTSHDGQSQQGIVYQAFGGTTTLTGTSQNRLRYTGREIDTDTNRYYYRARYYDPSIGRFDSPDPIGFAGGINEYSYVGNNPINANDPSGLGPESIMKLVQNLAEKGIEGVDKLIARRGWRVSEREAVEQAAARGPNGGIVCPGCGNEVSKYDINHVKKWGETQREILDTLNNGGTVNRSEVRDLYGRNIEAKCPGCNRADNKLPAIAAGTVAAGASGNAQASDGGIWGSSITWDDVGDFLFDMVVPGGINSTGGCSNGVCSDMIYPMTIGPTSSYSPAGGGFLLYPNKANTNMMQSVYSK